METGVVAVRDLCDVEYSAWEGAPVVLRIDFATKQDLERLDDNDRELTELIMGLAEEIAALRALVEAVTGVRRADELDGEGWGVADLAPALLAEPRGLPA
jgi:hypothetical protein